MSRPPSDRLDAYFDYLATNCPPALQVWTATTESDFCAAVERAIESVILQLESGAHRCGSMDELGLSWLLVGFLTSASIPAVCEGFDNGHVHVTVKHPADWPFLILGQCKIYKDYDHHRDGCKQLLMRWSSGRSARSFCLEFFRSPEMYAKLRKLRDEFNSRRPLEQINNAVDHSIKGAFVTLHKHFTAAAVEVVHLGCNVFHPEAAATSAVPPKVDIGILTIRDDEFRAVLEVLPSKAGIFKGTNRQYTLRHADAGNDEKYSVAVLRLIEQGHGEAQDAARDLIEDLAPRLVLVVGIAGGLPSDDVKLGDVILSTRIHDFTVEARKAGQEPTYAVTGGPVAKELATAVVNLAGREDDLGDWAADLPAQPPVTWTRKGQLCGSPAWQSELRAGLEHHHGKSATPRAPCYFAGPCATSLQSRWCPAASTAQ